LFVGTTQQTDLHAGFVEAVKANTSCLLVCFPQFINQHTFIITVSVYMSVPLITFDQSDFS